MTVGTTSRSTSATGNGATTTFATGFQFFELAVYVNGILKTLGVDYTVTGGSGLTGNVVFGAAPASGAKVFITSNTTRHQPVDYVDNDDFPAETHEKALDRLTMESQDLNTKYEPALRFKVSDGVGASQTEMDLTTFLGKYVFIGADGVPVAVPSQPPQFLINPEGLVPWSTPPTQYTYNPAAVLQEGI